MFSSETSFKICLLSESQWFQCLRILGISVWSRLNSLVVTFWYIVTFLLPQFLCSQDIQDIKNADFYLSHPQRFSMNFLFLTFLLSRSNKLSSGRWKAGHSNEQGYLLKPSIWSWSKLQRRRRLKTISSNQVYIWSWWKRLFARKLKTFSVGGCTGAARCCSRRRPRFAQRLPS